MKKLLLTNLILLILLSICGCSGQGVASNEDKIFQAIAQCASQNSSNAGNTNRVFFDQRFDAYYDVLERLQNANIIQNSEVTRFKEAGEANKQSLQNYLTEPEKNQNMSNYITSNCSWCLGPDTLLQLIHWLSYINTSKVASNNSKAEKFYYSTPLGMSKTWFTEFDKFNNSDPMESMFNISMKNVDTGKVQNAIDKLYAILTNDNVIGAVGGDNLKGKHSIVKPNEYNKFYDLYTTLENSVNISCSPLPEPTSQGNKMSSVFQSFKSGGEHPEDRQGAVDEAEKIIEDIIPQYTKGGKYAVMSYTIKVRQVKDEQGNVTEYYQPIINLYVAPLLRVVPENNWTSQIARDTLINASHISPRLIGIEDSDNDAQYIGLSTLTSSKTSGGSSDSVVNSKIYVFNPTSANMENIDKFLGFMKQYENSTGDKQKRSGDQIYKYLKDTYEVLESNDGNMFKSSKGDTSLTTIKVLVSNIANGVSLSSVNKPSQIGKDFIYDYDDIPLFSLRLFEIRPDADVKIDKMRDQKKLEGYMTINKSDGKSVQFRTWQRLDVINKITTKGVDVIHSDLIYDFKEQLWYKVVVNAGGSGISFDYEGLNNIPDSQIQFDAPGDNLNNDERKLIFTRENFSNQDVPYFDINKTVMSGTEPGHLLLLEYRCLYDITDSKMVQENQDRKLTDKAWLPIGRRVYFNADNITVQDGENGESVYRWVKAKTPVAYLSDPISGRINTDYPLFCDSFTDITHSQKLNTIIDLENESATYNNGNYQNTGGLNIIADNQDLIRYTANGQ